MGNGEQIKAAIEVGLSQARDQTKRGEPQRPAKKPASKVPELDLAHASGQFVRSLGDPLGRLMPALVEMALNELDDEASVDQVGAVLLGLEQFDAADERWDETVASLFRTALTGWLQSSPPPTSDPGSVQLTEAVAAGIADAMKGALLVGETPRAVSKQTETRLGQVMVALLHHTNQAVSEAISLQVSPRCQEWARHLSASVGSFCIENGNTPLAEVLLRPPMLDRLVSSLWRVVADFPGAFADAGSVAWWRDVLAELARPRRDETAYEPDLVAEAVVLIVERGAADYTALVRNPSNKQLFLTMAMRGLMEVLSESIGEESKYRLVERLGRTELYLVMQAVVNAWIERPEWLFRKPAQQERAATLLPVLVEALAELNEGSLKGLLRHDRLQRVLVVALISGLSSKLSSLNGRRVASVLNPVLLEFAAMGYAGWSTLLEQDRLADLLSAISKSKIEEKLFSEDPEDVRTAGRAIALVGHELRCGRVLPLSEMVERLNKGK